MRCFGHYVSSITMLVVMIMPIISLKPNISADEIPLSHRRPLIMLLPSQEAVISTRISSTISEVNMHEGMAVPKGKLLLLLDKKEFELEKTVLQKELAKLTPRRKFFESELKRNTKLLEKSVISQSNFDNVKRQYDIVNEEAKVVEAKLGIAELELSYCEIRAPFSGYITKEIAHQHEHVLTGDPLFKIICVNPLHVVVNFHEAEVGRLELGREFDFKLRHSDLIRQAKIIRIHPEIDPETKTIKVIAQIGNKDNRLKPSMIGTFLGFVSNKSQPTKLNKP